MSRLGPLDEDAADLHELALVEAEVADERVRVGAQPDADSSTGAARRRIAARSTRPQARGLLVGEQVGQDGALREEAQLLVDDADARAAGILRRARSVTAAPDTHIVPRSGSDRAGEDLHERGLAGAVLAHDGVDGAGLRRRGPCRRGPGCRRRTWTDRRRRPPASRSPARGSAVGQRASTRRSSACQPPRSPTVYLASFSMGSSAVRPVGDDAVDQRLVVGARRRRVGRDRLRAPRTSAPAGRTARSTLSAVTISVPASRKPPAARSTSVAPVIVSTSILTGR